MPADPILANLSELYDPETAAFVRARIEERIRRFDRSAAADPRPLDQRDALLITYGDQFRHEGIPPLAALERFARRLEGVFTGLHVLPFYPYTSDDGFSVVDYRRVDPALGSWEDIARLQERFLLMYDAVINHASVASDGFQRFLRAEPPYRDFFITVPPGVDLSRVVRPRALPLLTPFDTAQGEKLVWTTFSSDQVDLNYRSPELLLEILDVLLGYAGRGARLLRLDAIAYLWKEPGTACIHLPQAHAVIRLIRAVLDRTAPQVLLVSETNVPHVENISYFGDGFDEAQMVYNFALPPLTLHAFAAGDARVLSEWAAGLRLPSEKTAFFNFLASHDGIGLNPARGILPEREVRALVERARAHGGLVSLKNNPDGAQSAYELNISYFDALSDPASAEPPELQARRFLAAHAVLLSLAGLPGIYVHSLLGSRSWAEGARRSGHNRAINREKFTLDEIERELDGPGLRREVYRGMARMLRARAASPAFHPHGGQAVLDAGPGVFALLRVSPGGEVRAVCLVNVTAQPVEARLALPPAVPRGRLRDLLSGGAVDLVDGGVVRLEGYQAAWFIA